MDALLKVEGLKKYFPAKKTLLGRALTHVKAVDGIDFTIGNGETFGVVGESGCGKSTLGRAILRLIEATEGKVHFDGKDVYSLNATEMKKLRTDMQIIFQDPYSSLNPKMSVLKLIGCGMREHGMGSYNQIEERVGDLMEQCGLSPKFIRRYPHEFSGGQRQRIGIARALALNPKFIVCDEPVSALDVSVQAQVINLLMELQHSKNLTYLFISHDLSVVKHICNRIGVIYLGNMTEIADKKVLFNNPLHPYTQSLLSVIPVPDPTVKRERIILQGDIPSPSNAPSGCKFRTRCPQAKSLCSESAPLMREVEPGHLVACHLV